MSDLIGNHIVGFPMWWPIYCKLRENQLNFEKLETWSIILQVIHIMKIKRLKCEAPVLAIVVPLVLYHSEFVLSNFVV